MADYGYSFCRETSYYTGGYSTLDDAFDAAVCEAKNDPDRRAFYISLFHGVTPHWTTNAEDIVGEIAESMSESTGEVFVGEIASPEEITALDEALGKCINDWFDRYSIGAGFKLVSWTKRYVWNYDQLEYVEDLDFNDD